MRATRSWRAHRPLRSGGGAARRAQDRGEIDRAIGLWKSVLERSPENPEAMLFVGYCLLRKGDTAGARDAYAKALRLAPQWPASVGGVAARWDSDLCAFRISEPSGRFAAIVGSESNEIRH